MASTEVVLAPRAQVVSADDFLPLMTVEQAVERKNTINRFITDVLRESEDFGVIPGTKSKPVLLKPGAEKLCSIFGLVPRFICEAMVEDWTGADHAGEPFFYYRYRCELWRGDKLMGDSVGSCNSWESKYRWRDQSRKCPECGAAAIIKGKDEYGGGWLCFKKKGGCGAKFVDEAEVIVMQPLGRVPNADVADQVNTLQKMAQKRALIPVVLIVTNCSDAFTQDVEDIDTGGHPVGTKEASDYVRDKKLAQAGPRGEADKRAGSPADEPHQPPTQPVHPTLQAMFTAIEDRSKAGNVKLAFDMMKKRLVDVMPGSGEDAYHRILKERNLKAGVPIQACKDALIEMWELASFAREQQMKLGERSYQATDDDVPIMDEPAGAEVSK